MPIYEYECPVCGVFEAIQSSSEKPLKCKPDCTEKKCPKKAERLISQSAFHLKGGGWYKTDYASTNTSSAAKSKSGEKSDSAASTEGSSNASAGDSSDGGKKKSLAKVKGGGGSCGSGCGCH